MTFDEWLAKTGAHPDRLTIIAMRDAWAAALEWARPEGATPMSLRAFGSPDALGSYCINLALKRDCTEWLIAYELLYGRAPQERSDK